MTLRTQADRLAGELFLEFRADSILGLTLAETGESTMTEGPVPADPDVHGQGWEGWESPQQPASSGMSLDHRSAGKAARRGRSALVTAICVIAASVIWSVLVGVFGTTIYQYNDVSAHGVRMGFNAHPNLIAAGFQILLGSVFGIWALVQGIIATARNEGRKSGIAAIIIAGAAPILSLIVWIVVGFVAGTHVAQ